MSKIFFTKQKSRLFLTKRQLQKKRKKCLLLNKNFFVLGAITNQYQIIIYFTFNFILDKLLTISYDQKTTI